MLKVEIFTKYNTTIIYFVQYQFEENICKFICFKCIYYNFQRPMYIHIKLKTSFLHLVNTTMCCWDIFHVSASNLLRFSGWLSIIFWELREWAFFLLLFLEAGLLTTLEGFVLLTRTLYSFPARILLLEIGPLVHECRHWWRA